MCRYPKKHQGNEAHIHREIYSSTRVWPYGQNLLWYQLSLIQQLNCICDTFFKQALMSATTQGYHDRPTQLLPKEDVAVVIWGNKITDDVSHPIKFHASKEVARKYLGNRKKNP